MSNSPLSPSTDMRHDVVAAAVTQAAAFSIAAQENEHRHRRQHAASLEALYQQMPHLRPKEPPQ